METIRQIRQGDVLLTRVSGPRRGAARQEARGIRIAGERTGHAHTLDGEVWTTPRSTTIRVEEERPILHEEHGATPVQEGWWDVTTQREYVPRERRTVGRWD